MVTVLDEYTGLVFLWVVFLFCGFDLFWGFFGGVVWGRVQARVKSQPYLPQGYKVLCHSFLCRMISDTNV